MHAWQGTLSLGDAKKNNISVVIATSDHVLFTLFFMRSTVCEKPGLLPSSLQLNTYSNLYLFILQGELRISSGGERRSTTAEQTSKDTSQLGLGSVRAAFQLVQIWLGSGWLVGASVRENGLGPSWRKNLGLARAGSLWYMNSISSNLCKEIEHVNIQIFS
jgi:hypothetical protein